MKTDGVSGGRITQALIRDRSLRARWSRSRNVYSPENTSATFTIAVAKRALLIRRRAIDAGLSAPVSRHSFRGTGITVYLENKGTLETAQKIAAHELPRTTKLYDRTDDQLTLDEIEKISV
jgi:hypothetical protein